MKKTLYRLTAAFFAIVVSFAAVLALAGCGSSKTTDSSNSSKTDKKAVEAVAGDYYLDLSDHLFRAGNETGDLSAADRKRYISVF